MTFRFGKNSRSVPNHGSKNIAVTNGVFRVGRRLADSNPIFASLGLFHVVAHETGCYRKFLEIAGINGFHPVEPLVGIERDNFRQRDRMRVVDGERSISQLNRRTNRAVVEFLAGLIVVRQKEKFAVDERHR